MREKGLSSIYYSLRAVFRIMLSKLIGIERKLDKLDKLEALIMASQEDLLAAVEAAKLELLAAADAERVQTLEQFAVLNQRIAELEAIIAAGGDTQPAIDAVKAAAAAVKASIEGITV